MTQKQKKRLFLYGSIAVAAIIIWLLLRKQAVASSSPSSYTFPNVQIPGLDLPPRGAIALNLPALAGSSPYDFGAVSTCMCDGSTLAPTPEFVFNSTSVYNAPNQGPTIYNYFNTVEQTNPLVQNPYAAFASYGN